MLDACAGAGGKTLLLAAAVGAAGRVHAADPDAARLDRLRTRAARAGAGELVVVHGDAAPTGLAVDRVLVDAPCSELGALRRGPDLRWRLDPAAFAPLPALQRTILERALSHVRPGGILVYATCTFRREEDEDVALALEADHPELDPRRSAGTRRGAHRGRLPPHLAAPARDRRLLRGGLATERLSLPPAARSHGERCAALPGPLPGGGEGGFPASLA